MPGSEINIRDIVERAAAQYARENDIRISEGALDPLISRAEAHMGEIQAQLQRGETSIPDIYKAAIAQLRVAESLQGQVQTMSVGGGDSDSSPGEITRELVEMGIMQECKWIPWC